MVNQEFVDPYITCCWVGEYRVFVNFFHSYTLTHYHFIYDIREKKMLGTPQNDEEGKPMHHDKPIQVKMACNNQNFPYKSFYNDEKNEIYTFYRQGDSYCINPDDLSDYTT